MVHVHLYMIHGTCTFIHGTCSVKKSLPAGTAYDTSPVLSSLLYLQLFFVGVWRVFAVNLTPLDPFLLTLRKPKRGVVKR